METLENEVKAYANGLSYWKKFLADKILSGIKISDNDIDTAYSYLLETLKINPLKKKPEIKIDYNPNTSGTFNQDLLFTKLENVEGVNALSENQLIEFSPKITLIYGATGSGKSGYVRLMKKAFYSKVPEEIIHNIHLKSGHKPIKSKFTFQTKETAIPLIYPTDSSSFEFSQFAVFDGKCVLKYLDQRNEFEFCPAALGFFSDLTEAIKRVEAKLNTEILAKSPSNNFPDLFDGDSEIKTLIHSLSASTNLSDLKKYTPFSEKDKTDIKEFEKQYNELLLITINKDKEIIKLETIKQFINSNKKDIEEININFTTDYLTIIRDAVKDCVDKEAIAKAEGVENFKSNKIKSIGTPEWKNFIISAEQFAGLQKEEGEYPDEGDNCLLCQQNLSTNAQELIKKYWVFIKSIAEQNAKEAQEILIDINEELEKIKFDLFPPEHTLTVWLTEKYPKVITSLKQSLSNQKSLGTNITSDIKTKKLISRLEIQTSTKDHDKIISDIDSSIKLLRENQQTIELDRLLKSKTKLQHKEKLNLHLSKFENFIQNQLWLLKSKSVSWIAEKREITDYEKYLSDKYFNQKYFQIFKQECKELNGNFGISINHTGSGGTSYRQLFIGQKNPSTILSEGEQKVIALADFLSEMQLSEANRGIIFDDPVTSLDESRKKDIASRLCNISDNKQVIIFTHDLIFVSNIITYSEENKIPFYCHWIETRDGKPGHIWLRNSPSYEKEYRNSEPVKKLYVESKKDDCQPNQREFLIKSGFTALRTCYEVLVINDLFKNVVQRYNERVSIDSLKDVYFDEEIVKELKESFDQCCRYMEGHTHSDKYSYKKPEPENLNEEIQRYEALRTKIKKIKKPSP